MDSLSELLATLKANAAAIIGLGAAFVSGYFALMTKRSGDNVEVRKVGVDDRRVEVDERKLVLEERARQEARFDKFMERLEREREEARKENAELRKTVQDQTGHIQALTDRSGEQMREITSLRQQVEALKDRVGQLIGYIKQQGGEPPPPPGHFPP